MCPFQLQLCIPTYSHHSKELHILQLSSGKQDFTTKNNRPTFSLKLSDILQIALI